MNLGVACHVFAWLITRAPLTDHTEMHLPIMRDPKVVAAIALAVSEENDPAYWAGVLDVWSAYETGYRNLGGACPGVNAGTPCSQDHAATCGYWMVLCTRVRGADVEKQAAIALDTFRESARACPLHPFGFYAGGVCAALDVVDDRLRHVREELDR